MQHQLSTLKGPAEFLRSVILNEFSNIESVHISLGKEDAPIQPVCELTKLDFISIGTAFNARFNAPAPSIHLCGSGKLLTSEEVLTPQIFKQEYSPWIIQIFFKKMPLSPHFIYLCSWATPLAAIMTGSEDISFELQGSLSLIWGGKKDGF